MLYRPLQCAPLIQNGDFYVYFYGNRTGSSVPQILFRTPVNHLVAKADKRMS